MMMFLTQMSDKTAFMCFHEVSRPRYEIGVILAQFLGFTLWSFNIAIGNDDL